METTNHNPTHVLTLRRRNPARATSVSLPKETVDMALHSIQTDAGLLAALLAALVDEAILTIASRAGDLPSDDGAMYPLVLAPSDILSEVTRLHLPWVTSEELSILWETSPTKAAIFDQAKWTANRGYRLAYEKYKSLILSLAGKATRLELEDINWLRSKWAPGHVELDRFVFRRLAQMEAALTKEAETFDRDAF